ncbi:MAG: carboxypeptidase regulatory-like domain-containing protein [bacterium]|nr:carboxypeptidase regulatory-like domain-containing protein [bacterium]
MIQRMSVLALFVTLACAVVQASQGESREDPETGFIRGKVWKSETTNPLVGVRIVALADGVTPVATSQTGERGEYLLAVEPGTYDVRFLASEERYTATFLHDLLVEPGRTLEREVELANFDQALRARFIEPKLVTDADGDFVPDTFERAVGLNPFEPDTDDDGVIDGVATWLGVGPRPTKRAGHPVLMSPPKDVPFVVALGGGAPLTPIVFRAVPGATGYTIDVLTERGTKLLDSRTFDFESGAFLLGEGVAVNWSIPLGVADGTYQLRIQGYVLEPHELVGTQSERKFDLVSGEPQPLEITEDVELSGVVVASSVYIHSGAVLSVPEDTYLRLIATDEIVVEWDAHIFAKSESDLYVSAGRGMRVAGSVQTANAEPGEHGGNLTLAVHGSLSITNTGIVASGDGGPGLESNDGGAGGDLVLFAGQQLVADRPGRIAIGSGGRGGDGHRPGIGGASGNVWLSDWDVRRDRFIALGDLGFPIQGGVAGEPGEPLLSVPSDESGTSGENRDGADDVRWGRKGPSAWRTAGKGQAVVVTSGAGAGRGAGGRAEARGGDGGDVTRIGLGRYAFEMTFGYTSRGGDGGEARAIAGTGGATDSRGQPGRGGAAFATGGSAGSGLRQVLALPSGGGVGGGAFAQGGTGQKGSDNCGGTRPGTGGNGSAGGDAEARGGNGGKGPWFGGTGGNGVAISGTGGPGGKGSPPGRGGLGGNARVAGGDGGDGLHVRGQRGGDDRRQGGRGKNGSSCGGR